MADKEKKAKGLLKEFKEFISRGNVLDMAIGVIIATAFGKITTSLVNDVFMPLIGYIFGGVDLSKLNIVLSQDVVDEAGEVVKAGVTIGIGTFLSTIIDFVIVAFIVFLIVKAFNKARELSEKNKKAEEPAPAAEPEPTKEEVLLTEIRDLLKDKKNG
jgi:large conductance mechanosensitive channel